jgi:hypothetical protein
LRKLTTPVLAGTMAAAILGLASPAIASAQGVTPPTGTQLAQLQPSDNFAYNNFGSSVAISGPTLVVGAPNYPSLAGRFVGRAYVFSKTATGWQQSAELAAPDGAPGDGFGSAVAVSGSTVVVGAANHDSEAGRAYVFSKTSTGWNEAELEASDAKPGDWFGLSVAASGTTVVVGAPTQGGPDGRVYVFKETPTGWHQVAEFKNYSSYNLGGSVAIAGNTVAAGSNGSAQVYVFTQNATGWQQSAILGGLAAYPGDSFGASVAISGTTLVVGDQDISSDEGAALVFNKTVVGWQQSAELTGGEDFGAVAISGNTVVVGASAALSYAGRASIFTKSATGWSEKDLGTNSVPHDEFGASVAVSGLSVVVGVIGPDTYAGMAYVFQG